MVVPGLVRRLSAFILVVATLLTVVAAPASAETTIEVTTPADGRFEAGEPTPLIVTIAADRAISGTITANFDGFRAGSQQIDVPGGSTKEIVFVVTTLPWGESGTLNFVGDNGDDSASARINLIQNRGDELVALLGDLATRDIPATAELSVDIGQARLYAIDESLLDAGPEALSPFRHVVSTIDDLEALDPSRLAALEAWVAGDGGSLIVDDDPGTALPLAGLDGASALSTTTEQLRLGLGTVRFSDGAAATGSFDGLIRATPSRSRDQFPWGGQFEGAPTTPSLASDAGVSVPPIGALLIILIAYLVIIGPVLWFLLRRSRREPLLWLAVPAVALVTTLGVYGFGRSLRDASSSAHATIVAEIANTRSLSTQVLVTSANGSTEGVRLDPGWRPGRVGAPEFFFEQGSGPVQGVLIDGDLVVDLPPGGAGVIGAEATMPTGTTDSAWQLDLSSEDGALAVSATNLTSHSLEEVMVVSGQGFQQIGSVEPGESIDVTLRQSGLPPLANDRFAESFWRNSDPFSSNDGASNPGLLMNWLGQHPTLRTPGFIFVVGWTRDEPSPLDTSRGTSIEAGRTAFLTAQRIDDNLVFEEPYRMELLRGWQSDPLLDTPLERCEDFPITLRMIPTAGLDLSDAVLDLSTRSVSAMDVWDGAEWQPAGLAEAPEQRIIMTVPPPALADGELYLRINLGCEFWEMANPFPDLRPATADDEAAEIGKLGEAGEPDA